MLTAHCKEADDRFMRDKRWIVTSVNVTSDIHINNCGLSVNRNACVYLHIEQETLIRSQRTRVVTHFNSMCELSA